MYKATNLVFKRISHEVVTFEGGGGSCDEVTNLPTSPVDITNLKTTELKQVLLMSVSNGNLGVYNYFVLMVSLDLKII